MQARTCFKKLIPFFLNCFFFLDDAKFEHPRIQEHILKYCLLNLKDVPFGNFLLHGSCYNATF